MTREKVLVTGSAGHLGDALARALRGHGYEVVGLDLLASPSTTAVGSITEWAPRYDFRWVLDRLRAGEEPRSPLTRAVGAKGYHAETTGVYTVR